MTKPDTWRLETKTDNELLAIVQHQLWRQLRKSKVQFWLYVKFGKKYKWLNNKLFATWYAFEASEILVHRKHLKKDV